MTVKGSPVELTRRAVRTVAGVGVVTSAVLSPVAAQTAFAAQNPSPGYGPKPCHHEDTVTPSNLTRGQSFTVHTRGNCGHRNFDVDIHSTSEFLGTITTDASGNGAGSFIVPTNLPSGAHSISVGDTVGDVTTTAVVITGGPYTGASSLTAAAPAAAATPAASQSLPFTGSNASTLAAAGAATIGVGGLLVLGARKRRRAAWRP